MTKHIRITTRPSDLGWRVPQIDGWRLAYVSECAEFRDLTYEFCPNSQGDDEAPEPTAGDLLRLEQLFEGVVAK